MVQPMDGACTHQRYKQVRLELEKYGPTYVQEIRITVVRGTTTSLQLYPDLAEGF